MRRRRCANLTSAPSSLPAKPSDRPPIESVATLLEQSADQPDPALVDAYCRLLGQAGGWEDTMRQLEREIAAHDLAFETAKRFLEAR